MTNPVRVAVVGSGPAGIYASDLLVKSDLDVQIDPVSYTHLTLPTIYSV